MQPLILFELLSPETIRLIQPQSNFLRLVLEMSGIFLPESL